MWKIIHTCVSIDFIEECLDDIKSIKDFLKDASDDDLKDLYCYKMFWMDYEDTKISLEKLKAEWKVCIPNSNCNNVTHNWTCWCNS